MRAKLSKYVDDYQRETQMGFCTSVVGNVLAAPFSEGVTELEVTKEEAKIVILYSAFCDSACCTSDCVYIFGMKIIVT